MLDLAEELRSSTTMRSKNPELCLNSENKKKQIEVLDVLMFLYFEEYLAKE
ncbi:hypothetical protein NSQ20_12080 [Paenibacillus sp. FSL K6-1122]|uniref:hypothetical protein n=1 Tax=Paenibacillus sp. FSL K6-1122 TaxID=2954512 RepID=UPI0030EB70DA